MCLEGYSEEQATELCNPDGKSFVSVINDYSIVIQEFFQCRTQLWLETVGKDVFDIAHYWVRYEFAPGRGQIHAHLLAIPNDQSIYKEAYQKGKEEKDQQSKQRKRAEVLGKWAEQKFGLTASVDNTFEEIDMDRKSSPVLMKFEDITKNKMCTNLDKQKCLKHCQTHYCSSFCLRENKNNKGYV